MFTEDDLLLLSGLQHLVFCERQWGLIHLEGQWAENRLTVEGRRLHERVDETQTESRGDVRIVRGLRIRSLRLGLSGRADVVEFHRIRDPNTNDGVRLPDVEGTWRPIPVEYKRGRPKRDNSDKVQLCAQALCLEDMLSTSVSLGALYYGRQRRRYDVELTSALRDETERLAAHMHALMQARTTPRGVYEKKCERCSLIGVCLPRTTSAPRSTQRYLANQIRRAGAADETA